MQMEEYWKVEDLGDIYDKYVQQYWNWLLGKDADSPKQGNVLFMRIIYGYRNRWGIDRNGEPVMTRGNVSQINRMAEDKGLTVKKNREYIFLPVIDTVEHDFDRDSVGNQLTPQTMNNILKAENDHVRRKIEEGRVRATIRKLDKDGDKPPHEIVPDLSYFMIGVPGGTNTLGTFRLHVPSNSKLAGNLEYEFPKDTHLNARAEGIYLIFSIKESGLYQIRSSADGLRNYHADMNYYVSVN